MIVKLIAPGILPGDYVTADLRGVPQRGDTVIVETPKGDGEYDTETLTVAGVTWPVEIVPSIRHHAVAAHPEAICERAEDVGDLGDEDWRPSHPEQTIYRRPGPMYGAPVPASLCATERKPCDPVCEECRPGYVKPPRCTCTHAEFGSPRHFSYCQLETQSGRNQPAWP